MTATASKYAFQPIGDPSAAPPPRAGAARKVFTEADMAAARQEGVEQGRREASGQTDRAAAEALRAIARMMQMMLSGLGQEAQSLRVDAVEVALAAARQAAGAALDQFGAEALEAFVSDAAMHLRDTPRLVIKVAPDIQGEVEPRLVQAAAEAGFQGQVQVRGDAAARPGDCTLEWADGTIQHDREAAFEAIATAAERWLAAAEQQGIQLDMFST
jgi:flagellar assembly protein FliH